MRRAFVLNLWHSCCDVLSQCRQCTAPTERIPAHLLPSSYIFSTSGRPDRVSVRKVCIRASRLALTFSPLHPFSSHSWYSPSLSLSRTSLHAFFPPTWKISENSFLNPSWILDTTLTNVPPTSAGFPAVTVLPLTSFRLISLCCSHTKYSSSSSSSSSCSFSSYSCSSCSCSSSSCSSCCCCCCRCCCCCSSSSSSQYCSTTLSAEFCPSQPLPSIFFYPGQRSSNLALSTSVHLS